MWILFAILGVNAMVCWAGLALLRFARPYLWEVLLLAAAKTAIGVFGAVFVLYFFIAGLLGGVLMSHVLLSWLEWGFIERFIEQAEWSGGGLLRGFTARSRLWRCAAVAASLGAWTLVVLVARIGGR